MSSFGRDPEIQRKMDENDMDGLIKALEHADSKIVRDAAGALGEIGDPIALNALARLIENDDTVARVRESAFWALGKLGKPAVDWLIEALTHEKNILREKAARTLLDTKDTRAMRPLIQALEDEYWPVRKAAAISLGFLGDDSAVEALVRATQDGYNQVREEAERALHRLGRESDGSSSPAAPDIAAMQAAGDVRGLIEALSYERDAEVRKQAAEALGRMGAQEAVEPLIALLSDSTSRNFVSWNDSAVQALAQIGAPAMEPLKSALEHSKLVEVRAGVAEALGEIGDPQAIDRLLASLWDSKPIVRSMAAQALAKIGEPAVPRLIRILELHGKHAPIATADALKQIMGQDFRDDAAAWKQWWEEHGPGDKNTTL
ncbi:MAG: HEAT repeat domain-containing protein [Anaerolineales bacterium]|jgi:HEAT repeat protein